MRRRGRDHGLVGLLVAWCACDCDCARALSFKRAPRVAIVLHGRIGLWKTRSSHIDNARVVWYQLYASKSPDMHISR